MPILKLSLGSSNILNPRLDKKFLILEIFIEWLLYARYSVKLEANYVMTIWFKGKVRMHLSRFKENKEILSLIKEQILCDNSPMLEYKLF